eukprot:SAG11_NODE_1627_length_4552_cov_4.548619_3_plen_191_part_00
MCERRIAQRERRVKPTNFKVGWLCERQSEIAAAPTHPNGASFCFRRFDSRSLTPLDGQQGAAKIAADAAAARSKAAKAKAAKAAKAAQDAKAAQAKAVKAARAKFVKSAKAKPAAAKAKPPAAKAKPAAAKAKPAAAKAKPAAAKAKSAKLSKSACVTTHEGSRERESEERRSEIRGVVGTGKKHCCTEP